MKVGFNIAMVCMVALLCIAAVAVTGLATGHNGTIIALAFAALGAIPASLITWFVRRDQEKKKSTKGGGD